MNTYPQHKANAVLSIVLDQAKDESGFHIEPYVNGREIGWAISTIKPNRKVAFSECRNSDSIVVYYGTVTDFSMQGNTPSEAVWRNSRGFAHNGYVEAAVSILNHMEGK